MWPAPFLKDLGRINHTLTKASPMLNLKQIELYTTQETTLKEAHRAEAHHLFPCVHGPSGAFQVRTEVLIKSVTYNGKNNLKGSRRTR